MSSLIRSGSGRSASVAAECSDELRSRLERLLSLSKSQLRALDQNNLAEFDALLESRQCILNGLQQRSESTPAYVERARRSSEGSAQKTNAGLTDEEAALLAKLKAHDRYLMVQLQETLRRVGERLSAVRARRAAGKAYGADETVARGFNSVR